MGVFIQMDNINDVDKTSQKKMWDKIKQGFSGRDAVGYSSYPLLNKTGVTYSDDIIIVLDKIYGILAFDIKEYGINDVIKIGENSWVVNNGPTKFLNPNLQSKHIFSNFTMQLNVSKCLRYKMTYNYFLVLPNISEQQWKERGYTKITSDINILFKDDINSDLFMAKVIKINYIESEDYNNKNLYLEARQIIEKNNYSICKKSTTTDMLASPGPISINSIACKW